MNQFLTTLYNCRCRVSGEFGEGPGRPISPTDNARPAWRCGGEEFLAVADRRARGGFHKDQCGSGRAKGSKRARHDYATYTLVCRNCQGLVDRARAQDVARLERRNVHYPGDGCGHPKCSKVKRAQPSTYHRKQMKMVHAIRDGSRVLTRWPDGPEDHGSKYSSERNA
jgi:hypothetical protein